MGPYYNTSRTVWTLNNMAKAEMKVKIMTAGKIFWVDQKWIYTGRSHIWCLYMVGEVLNGNRSIVFSYPGPFPNFAAVNKRSQNKWLKSNGQLEKWVVLKCISV